MEVDHQVERLDLFYPAQACKFLNLDHLKKPELTLARYRRGGLLKAVRLSGRIMYRKDELLRFLDRVAV